MVLAVVLGTRSIGNAEATVEQVQRRVEPDVCLLLTSDEYAFYEPAIKRTLCVPVTAPVGPGRPRVVPQLALPEGLVDATVHEHREAQRVAAVEQRLIFGTASTLATFLACSEVSDGVKTLLLERQNGAARGRNACKVRKSYRFGKDWQVHEAMTHLVMYGANFCWVVHTLRMKDKGGRWRRRSPAMAAGLTDHLGTWREWSTRPAMQSE